MPIGIEETMSSRFDPTHDPSGCPAYYLHLLKVILTNSLWETKLGFSATSRESSTRLSLI